MKQKPYITNSLMWKEFWVSAHRPPHQVLEIQSSLKDIQFANYLYIYPWVQGRLFAYVSKLSAPVVDQNSYYGLTAEIISKCREIALQKGCSFIQFDINAVDGLQFDTKSFEKEIEQRGFKLQKARKSLQYHHTIRKDCHSLQSTQGYDIPHLQLFFDVNNQWFGQTSSKLRRYTRKALQADTQIRVGRSELLSDFKSLLSHTAKRQEFATHTHEYYERLAQTQSTYISIVYNKSGDPISGWFGIADSDTMYYLYGGNTQEGLKKYGSYLTQLMALKLCADKHLMYYDLGGYDKEKGYGLFKEMFHGEVITFPGDWVIPIKKDYRVFNTLLKIRDLVR